MRRGVRWCAAVLVAFLVGGCAGWAGSAATDPRPTARAVPPSRAASAEPTPARPRPSATPAARQRVADPLTISVPAIGVRATLVGVGLQADGAMEVPAYDANQAGWYTEGPRPGEVGPAVVAAHVDSKRGPDVFWRLRELDAGNTVTVTDRAGVDHSFVVERMERADKDALPYDRIWGNTRGPTLRLITCGGPYDRSRGGYQQNLIVYARPAPTPTAGTG